MRYSYQAVLKSMFLDWYLKIGVASAFGGASIEFFMVKTGFCVRNFLSHSLNTLATFAFS
ncbi:transmembrane protein, putative [Medicago truncatula]|uniref:Transmembrane protein, putative n=1 Tax=Medicago truncatula TaxID=3880 RepID=G7IGI8_MEDTR|nr:transmembrane protein, putative [Medicago truncatula]